MDMKLLKINGIKQLKFVTDLLSGIVQIIKNMDIKMWT